MPKVPILYQDLVKSLETAGKESPYPADANEPDPRYLSYGVRMPQVKKLIQENRKAFRELSREENLELGRALIESGYGEQQTIAMAVLAPVTDYFTPNRFSELDDLMRNVHGWSKVDGFCLSTLKDILLNHPGEMIELARQWNQNEDEMWLRRISVVLFTRKVAASGKFNDVALEFCDRLKFDLEDLVQKGVGWSLKDMMKSEKKRIIDYVKTLRAEGVSSTITLYAIRDLKGAERAEVLDIG